MTLAIDQLLQRSEEAPREPLLPGRVGAEWAELTNMRAWILSGAIASWLIARGYGPGGRSLALRRDDSPQRVALLLGALRAGALVVEESDDPVAAEPSFGTLAAASIDAAVAERRLHIEESTPARRIGGALLRHGDFKTIEQAVSG